MIFGEACVDSCPTNSPAGDVSVTPPAVRSGVVREAGYGVVFCLLASSPAARRGEIAHVLVAEQTLRAGVALADKLALFDAMDYARR